MKRVAIWRAVSSLPQAKKISLDDQLNQGLAVIKRFGAHMAADLEVHGESRSIILFEDACERIEAYKRLKGLIDAKAIDVLIYLDVSRLGRTAALIMTVAELCTSAKILLYELDNSPASLEFEPPDYDALLIRAIKATGAQHEVRKSSDRHQRGMIGRVMAGLFPAKPNYGYIEIFKPTGEHDRYEIEEPKIAVVLLIIDLYLEKGWGHRTIADKLNRDGIDAPDGGLWQYGGIAFVLRHIWQYAGIGELNRRNPSGRPYIRHPGTWPAVISEETARRVLAEMESRDKSPRSTFSTYRFSRMVFCNVCGAPMGAGKTQRNYTRRDGCVTTSTCFYYRCPGGHSRTLEYKVHAELTKRLEWLQDRAHREQLIVTTDTKTANSIMAEIERHQAQIEKAHTGIKRADDDYYVYGRLDMERHATITAGVNKTILAAQSEITKLQDQLHEIEQVANMGERLDSIQANGLAYLNHEDVKVANAWLHSHIKVWVDTKIIVAVEFF